MVSLSDRTISCKLPPVTLYPSEKTNHKHLIVIELKTYS
jgi:hypothetical protein